VNPNSKEYVMKRFFASALILSAVAGFGVVGCGETTSSEKVQEVTTGPGGTTTTTSETTQKKSSDTAPNPGEPGTTTTPAK
jgi:hypothetical protein